MALSEYSKELLAYIVADIKKNGPTFHNRLPLTRTPDGHWVPRFTEEEWNDALKEAGLEIEPKIPIEMKQNRECSECGMRITSFGKARLVFQIGKYTLQEDSQNNPTVRIINTDDHNSSIILTEEILDKLIEKVG